uniref:CEBP_ZZ domain-containing protein n=1 Tax=Elaeophora elaphi TaxID=1147741 RepID=A0A0R3RMG7_9BILA
MARSAFYNRYTIYVGGIPRVITAMEVAQLFKLVIDDINEVILEAEPDTNYPRGAVRMILGSRTAYVRAISMRHLTLFTFKERKMLEIRPYVLEGMRCEICEQASGPYLCPEISCLFYYCVDCFIMTHGEDDMKNHVPVSSKTIRLLWRKRQNPVLHHDGNFMPLGYCYYFRQQILPSEPYRQLSLYKELRKHHSALL